ncbi:Isochorismatase-like protein [Cantharellus anzutake]|uniref:Isochorismatase-like protein n=1 Tax=Cantharellus anzutake TaxID=1750568 RepID=UPI001904C99D|nr:Isochorismatase-like protein [Cantharellus anzutake]KAF8338976.1 Isochorismatase-like protein [Cantharellus anzutake]
MSGSKAINLFICDIQHRFRPAISNFDRVVATIRKIVEASKLFDTKIIITEHSPEVFGNLCPETGINVSNLPSNVQVFPKTKFSMLMPEVKEVVRPGDAPTGRLAVIVGIESHICVLQTALELLKLREEVVVIADGVSSCNPEEVPIALATIRQAGGLVLTSESFLYMSMGDAASPSFKASSKRRRTKLARL